MSKVRDLLENKIKVNGSSEQVSNLAGLEVIPQP